MMINKRLIGVVPDSKKYIAANVVFQWLSMISNVAMIFSFAWFLQGLAARELTAKSLLFPIGVGIVSIIIRWLCAVGAGKMSFHASSLIKKALRSKIYQKLLRLGPNYSQRVTTSEVVQVSTEGIEQLETYFGAYLPQFFYSMLAPVTLFAILAPISMKAAVALLVCVPLIPIAIAAVQTFAKKLLSRYWGQYTTLGDTFLENLQGLTTLKIYQADEFKNEEMNRESEKFRKITMKVLTMQLNSITIMDLVAFGGAALGLILAVLEFQAGAISFGGCFAIILLSADFFLPMRQLGSFFHIAMNGMAASDKIFALLDLEEDAPRTQAADSQNCSLHCENLRFSYEEGREILHGVTLEMKQGQFTAIVGESGCGKSTIAAILTGKRRGYQGTVTIGNLDLAGISNESLMQTITYVGFASYLFKGTVRENLLMGRPSADDEMLWAVLRRTKLEGFLKSEQGLDTTLEEQGLNFSGGQRQRLALARALLHDSPVYIFDEATSNIDAESENDIMEEIRSLAKEKTVILITHRLINVVDADVIYVMDHGDIVGSGTHEQLLTQRGLYHTLWENQQALEQISQKGVRA